MRRAAPALVPGHSTDREPPDHTVRCPRICTSTVRAEGEPTRIVTEQCILRAGHAGVHLFGEAVS